MRDMKMFCNQVFDAVFSLGYNCRCAMYLRDLKLRDCAGPFDWITDIEFRTRVDLICRGFDGYLELENLREQPTPPGDIENPKHIRVFDEKLNGLFLHDFPRGRPLSDSYAAVKEKYVRRITRLMRRLEDGGRYLLVWWGGRRIEDAELVEACRRLNGRFPSSQISLLAIDNVSTAAVATREVTGTSGRVWRAAGPFVKSEPDMRGDRRLCFKLFRIIRLRGAFRNKVRWAVGRFIVHALIWYLPTKAMRRRLKDRLTPIFLGDLS